jgi:hypothetical protein
MMKKGGGPKSATKKLLDPLVILRYYLFGWERPLCILPFSIIS